MGLDARDAAGFSVTRGLALQQRQPVTVLVDNRPPKCTQKKCAVTALTYLVGRPRRAPRAHGFLCVLTVLVSALGNAAQPASGVPPQIAMALPTAGKLFGKAARSHDAYPALQKVYADRANLPLWSRDGALTAQAQALLAELREADRYGLRPRTTLQMSSRTFRPRRLPQAPIVMRSWHALMYAFR